MLIGILKDIEAGNRNPHKGICGNVQDKLDCTYGVSESVYRDWIYVQNNIFNKWPEFSGNIIYPVPLRLFWVIPVDPALGFNPMFNGLNRWSGQYGRARKRLLRFIIEELDEKSL